MSIYGTVKRHLFWAHDYLTNHGYIKKQYDDIGRIINNYEYGIHATAEYLQKLLLHATETTEFYKTFSGRNFDQFPIINKAICLEYYEQFISGGFERKNLHSMSTNGSTGIPFTILQDRRKRSRVIAELKAFLALRGVKSHEKLLFFDALSAKNKTNHRKYALRENIWRFDVTNFNQNNIDKMVLFVKKHTAKAIISYPSALQCISNCMENDYRLQDVGVESIIVTGEALYKNVREKAKNVFGKQCQVISRYANQEMGILAQEDYEYGNFKLNTGSYYFECLNINDNEPVQAGTVGRIVITDLFNYAFPLIRYDTGDQGIMERDSNNSWPYLKKIYGKKNDIIFDSENNPVTPDAIEYVFMETESVKQWQIIQNDISDFVLRLSCRKEDKNEINSLIYKLREVVGGDPKIVVEYLDHIPSLAGYKQRFIICNIGKANR